MGERHRTQTKQQKGPTVLDSSKQFQTDRYQCVLAGVVHHPSLLHHVAALPLSVFDRLDHSHQRDVVTGWWTAGGDTEHVLTTRFFSNVCVTVWRLKTGTWWHGWTRPGRDHGGHRGHLDLSPAADLRQVLVLRPCRPTDLLCPHHGRPGNRRPSWHQNLPLDWGGLEEEDTDVIDVTSRPGVCVTVSKTMLWKQLKNTPPFLETSPRQLFGTLTAHRLWQLNLQSATKQNTQAVSYNSRVWCHKRVMFFFSNSFGIIPRIQNL